MVALEEDEGKGDGVRRGSNFGRGEKKNWVKGKRGREKHGRQPGKEKLAGFPQRWLTFSTPWLCEGKPWSSDFWLARVCFTTDKIHGLFPRGLGGCERQPGNREGV